MLESHHEDNPMLFDDDGSVTEKGADYIGKLDRLSGVRNARLRHGRWAAAEGVIYEDFGVAHILDSIEVVPGTKVDRCGVPLSWPRYWGVDFGYTNPFVIQCWAEDPDGRLYLYRELYMTRRTVDQHCRNILKIVKPNGNWIEPRPTNVVCDHDAEGRQVFEREMQLSTQPAHKSVLEGIEAVQVRLREAGDGKPRLFILRSALTEPDPELMDSGKPYSTLDEIPGYVWADKNKEEPVKADDHGCDAMRYVVADRDFGIRAIYRTVTAGYMR
jgi:phage terminase large subunit